MLSTAANILLVPPVNLAVLALAGLLLPRRWRRAGRWLCMLSLLALLALALPIVPNLLLGALEDGLAPTGTAAPQAIVILGGDDAADGPAPAQTSIGALTLERLRGGAALARATHLPVLVTGGVVGAAGEAVAVQMAQSLAADFATPARWVEPQAATTWDNAALSAALLRREGIGAVFVVTHAWHMRRALIAFRAAGFAATPAPLLPEHAPRMTAAALIPRPGAWLRSYFALHEWIGCAWYAIRAK
jgi:uncharacterized SAM-binding protein YcdF (DUF218 family)